MMVSGLMADHLSILNPNPQKIPGPDLLHNLVAPLVDDSKTAIEYLSPNGNVGHLSYAQLHQRAEALARALTRSFSNSISSADTTFIVPILIPQCPELYIAELAVLKAGYAFCPIALDVPEERLRFILNDTEANVFLTINELKHGLPAFDGITIITVDSSICEDDQPHRSVDVTASHPAYVMYTSGSTGLPKGVVLSHSAATQALLAHDEHIPQFSRFLQFANPTFDVSVFEIFFPLFRGCTLVCGDRRHLLNDLPGFINRMSIDAAELTPSVASSLLNGRQSVPSLKLLLTIGEMLKREVIDDFGGDSDEPSILWGMYGPTEATIHCTLQTAFSRETSAGTIGLPLSTVSAFVVQSQTKNEPENITILPVGEEGELAIGGYQLANGYLNRPEQTKAAFQHHPQYGMLYRTGDRARISPAGTIECSGRISSGQVKLRGQRIELGEIEYAASKTPGCKSTFADVINGSLVAFCVCDRPTMDKTLIKQTCRKWLPKFMVPADILILEALPYMASGKVDKKALHQLYNEVDSSQNGLEHEISPSLKAVIEIISDVLGVRVDSETQLSTVGLDSLSSIRISSRLMQAGFPQPDAMSLLESRTVRGITQKLDRLVEKEEIHSEDVTKAARLHEKVCQSFGTRGMLDDVEDAFAVTAVQSAMLYETAQDSHAYCNWIELAVSNRFTLKQVHGGLQDLARRHPLLRSGFVSLEGETAAYAVVVWKTLDPSQIQCGNTFDYDFSISGDEQLLRPSSIQLTRVEDSNRILLKIHHALYDQWSIDVLRADLGALLQGQHLPSPTSFHKVSASQYSHSEEQLDFWQDHLRDYTPTLLPIMTGKNLPRKLQRTPWRNTAVDLPSLRQKASALGSSAPAIFQAGMAYLLGCYSGSVDVCYGLVVSGRHLAVEGIEGVFGPCLATLPLRIDYSTTATCADLLRSLQERNRAMQKYAFTPLADIKKAAAISPEDRLFDVLFVWQESSIAFDSDSCDVREVDSADRHEFNLVVEFEPFRGGVRARATYQQALETSDQMDIMFEQLQSLAIKMLNDPDSNVAQLSELLPQKVLSIANPSPSSGTAGRTLRNSLEKVAHSTPNAPALAFARSITDSTADTDILNYKQLHVRANRLANFLLSRDVLPGDLVCICMEKCLGFYVAVLATIKIGAGYLPLVPETPRSRLRSILTQAPVKLCLCDSESQELFRDLHDVVLEVAHIGLHAFEPHAATVEVPGSSVAYVVFTSGSTGEPKGVAVTYDNLLGNLQVLAEVYRIQSGDRILQACSQAFDVSVFEIFFAMYTGMCLCSATKDVLFQDLESSIRAFGVSHLSLTPTVAALVDPSNVPSVRFLVTAGEGVTDIVHSRWAGKGLHQGYGPSETTNICSVKMMVGTDDTRSNIGPPLRNTSAFVVSTDAAFDILPAGSVGELAFGGEQVFRGYLGQEELTAERIVVHPQFGRLYKSGDVGRILSDGTLLIAGRLDDQVKIRGNRVELGEINSVLLQDSRIRDCTTIITGENFTEQSLASFVVFEQHPTAALRKAIVATTDIDCISSVLTRLEDSLPEYMRPSIVLPVTQLPLTSQGKLDKRFLRSLLLKLDDGVRERVTSRLEDAPNTEEWSGQERSIAAALAKTLHISESSLNRGTHFSAVGLTSLNAFAFSKLVSRSLNTEAKVSTIMRNPSIARLSKALGKQSESRLSGGHRIPPVLLPSDVVEQAQSACDSIRGDIESILPCTPLQEAMLSAGATSHGRAYANSSLLKISGDISLLRRSWEQMVARHAILRTSFVETQSTRYPYVQVTVQRLSLPWVEHSIGSVETNSSSSLGLPIRPSRVDATRPFAIDAITCDSDRWLILHMHHAIYDGISMSQLIQEVEHVYHGKPLQPAVQFQPFLEIMQSHQDDHAIEFWKKQLQGFRPRPFPTSQHYDQPKKELSIESTLQVSLNDMDVYCKRNAVSPLPVFQTALSKTLAACQNTKDICFGNVVSGRTVPAQGIERLVAPCFNTVPMRVELESLPSNRKAAQYLHQANVDILSYQLTPLRRIQSLSASPSQRLFDSLLIVQPAESPLDNSIWSLRHEEGAMNVPVVFEIVPRRGRYTLSVHYLQSIISTELVQSLAKAFESALRSCLRYPSSSIKNFHDFDDAIIAGCLYADDTINGEAVDNDVPIESEWDANEDAVRNVFARLTGVDKDRIQKDTSMYQIGLDSLNAAQVASQLRALSLNVDAFDVMEGPTPYSISMRASENESSASTVDEKFDLEHFDRSHRAGIQRKLNVTDEAIEAVRPCTPVQSGMLAQSVQSKGQLYINHVTYEVPESVSEGDIEHALHAIMSTHQVLRMGFHQVEDLRTPFAMSIFRDTTVTNSLRITDREVSLQAIEEMTASHIVESIGTQAWRVTIRPDSKGMSMTLSIHHALYDARSLRMMLEDFCRALSSMNLTAKRPIDSVLSSILAQAHENDDATANFWTKALHGAMISKFPDLNPKRVLHNKLRTEHLPCSLQLSQVESFCRNMRCTIQAVGQAAWALLLASYTGEDNVVFGTVFSGSQSEGIAFPDINTIPVSCDTGGSILDLLKKMVDYNASAQRHRFAALTDIQQWVGLSGQSLFDTVFVYQKEASNDATFDWSIIRETASVDYAASLEIENSVEDTLHFRLTYDNRRIPSQHAILLLQQYDHIVSQMISGDDRCPQPIYSILPAREPMLPTDVRFLHELVEQGAKNHPDRVALEFVYEASSKGPLTRRWTYRQLNERGNQVAQLLRQHQVPSETIVAVCMDKCPEASFAFIGLSKAGCAFLAIDPELPKSRIDFILKDSEAALLVVDNTQSKIAKEVTVPHVVLEEDSLSDLSSEAPSIPNLSIGDTCYCLYTSGTTGNPKGCEITHENTIQAMMAFQRLFAGRWSDNSRWLQFASFWFDVSVLEQFWSWGAGITVVGASRDLVLEDLPGFIQATKITHIDLTPSLARLLDPADVPSLCGGVFITGGEALKQEIINAWGQQRTICNGYGPTEATIGVTMNTFVDENAKPSNIGRQFDNVGSFVLRPGSDEPVLRGGIGELCVSGKLVGKGYLNRPDLTSNSFPFLRRWGERVYRTGDLVRLLADGSFSFIGRNDSQAKLRGQRLEIDEIDCAIKESANEISDVTSAVDKDPDGSKETLVSFIVLSDSAKTDELEIDLRGSSQSLARQAKASCRQRLPGYMVPTHIIPIRCLPLTVNKKIDTKRLISLLRSAPLSQLQNLDDAGDSSRAMDATEQKICAVLNRLLHADLKHIIPSSNIFSLGLSSISAISFAKILKEDGFQKASVPTIMSNSTIASLAAALSDGAGKEDRLGDIQQVKLSMKAFARRFHSQVAQSLCLHVDDIANLAPCTPLQQGLLLDSLRKDNRPYFNEFRYVLREVNNARLQNAIQKLVASTEALRTRFCDTDDGFAQIVLRRQNFTISERSVPMGDVDTVASELKTCWVAQNEHDISVPFEVHLIHTTPHDLLIIYLHHALYDGISYDLLIDRLAEIYSDAPEGDIGPTFADAIAYGPLRVQPHAKDFWISRLDGFHHIPLNAIATTDKASDVNVKGSVSDTAAIEKARKQLGVSHQALLQACFEIALRVHARRTQTYGFVVSGRSIDLDGADRIIGPMFNTLPQPLDIGEEASFSDHAKRCHDLNIAALPFQHTPLRDIRKWCGTDPTDAMFDVLFVFQAIIKSTTSKREDTFELDETAPNAEYPLACEIEMIEDESMNITLLAQPQYFDQESLQSVLTTIMTALDYTVNSGDRIVATAFDIVTAKEGKKAPDPKHPLPQTNGISHLEWNEQSSRIREIIAQLSGAKSSDIDEKTTIFALGMDSIDAVKLASRLKHAGISIPVSKLLQAQTIPRILSMVGDNKQPSERSSKTNLELLQQQLDGSDALKSLLNTGDIEKILPATPHQEGLVADMLRSELREYFNHDVLRLDPRTDLDRLKSAWQTVIDASAILRTTFRELSDPGINATFVQVVHHTSPIQFDERKLSNLKVFDQVFEEIRKEVLAHFEDRPLVRLTIVYAENERFIVFSLAHALYDGHSLALIHEDVQYAYHDKLGTRPSNDSAIEAALAATGSESQRYWGGTLSGARLQHFPRLEQNATESTAHHVEKRTSLTSGEARSFCQTHEISMQALVQTCWAIALAHYTRHLEVLFGVVLACRDSEEAEQVLFPMMNTVVLRSSLHGSRAQMLQYMQSTITDMLPYQRTPLRQIQAAAAKEVQKSISEGGAGLFDTLLIYQHKPGSGQDPSEKLYESVGGSSSVNYPVAVEMEAVGDDLFMRATCKGHVLDHQGTTELLVKMEEVLQAIVGSPDEPTVAFDGDQVSLCGLTSFKVPETDQDVSHKLVEEPVNDDPEMAEESALLPTILDAFAQVSQLPVAELKANSTIESIGIDSISAIKVSSLLRKQSIKLSVSDILKAKTAARMAQIVGSKEEPSQSATESSSEIIADVLKSHDLGDIVTQRSIDADNVQAILPATAGQIYMLSMWQKTRGQLFYPTFSYQVKAKVAMAQIEQAWYALVSRHDILRTVFCTTGKDEMPLLQVVLRKSPDSFNVAKSNLMSKGCNKRPMVSFTAVQKTGGYQVNLTIHHALYDAVSLPLLMQDFRSLLAGTQAASPKLGFEDFIALSISPSAREANKAFWTNYLQDVKSTQLTQPTTDGSQKRTEIFQPHLFTSAHDLEILARKESLSTQATLFAAYAKVCSAITEHDPDKQDVVLGIYLSKRSHLSDLDRLVAPTINLVPLLVRSPERCGLLEVARQIHTDLQEIGTASNSAVGLWEIERWTGVKVDTFVNFLKLPGADSNDDSGDGDGEVIELRPLDDRRLRERHEAVEGNEGDLRLPEEMAEMKTLDAYQHSVDIEMTITDGKLDVGLFAPEAMLGLDRAENVLEDLRRLLEKFVGKARE